MAEAGTRLSQGWQNIADSPIAWLSEAETLRAVAETVARRWVAALNRRRPDRRRGVPQRIGGDHSDFGRAFMMLAGYALEVLVKGIIITQRPDEIRGLWKRLTSGHDLLALVSEAGITLSLPAREFVGRAAAAATWSGRYPVAKTADRMIQDLKRGLPSHLDVETFHDVYSHLRTKMIAALRSP